MKKILKSAMLVALTAAGFTACSDEYDPGLFTREDILKEHYAENFTKIFGEVDPNQDWNLLRQLAEQGSNGATTRAYPGTTSTSIGDVKVEVLPESQAASLEESDLTAYSKMLPESANGENRISQTNLGRVTQNFTVKTSEVILYPVYWNTGGSNTIGLYYHVAKGTSGAVEVTKADGTKDYIIKVPITEGKPNELEYKYTSAGTWTNGNNSHVEEKWDELVLLESEKYIVSDGEQYNNYGQTIVSGKKIVKAGTASAWISGVYVENFTYYEELGANANVWKDLARLDPTLYKVAEGGEKYTWGTTASVGDLLYAVEKAGVIYASVLSKLTSLGNTNSVGTLIGRTDIEGYRSKGIKVTLPQSTTIGMYLTQGSNTVYSESDMNFTQHWASDGIDKDASFVATYTDENTLDENGANVRYLCFEDWIGTSSFNFDLNDCIFRVYGFDEIEDKDEFTEEGILVCEDLGTNDFDFNDVVLKLKFREYQPKTYTTDGSGNVTGVTLGTMTRSFSVTPMAAGGTLPSYVHSDLVNVNSEIHVLLGGNAPSIINAGPAFGSEGSEIGIDEVEGSFTKLNWDKTNYPTGFVSQAFETGLIQIKVQDTNGASRMINSTNFRDTNVPLMILLPTDFCWPQEDTPIDQAYPNFATWVNDATKTSWINNRIDGKVTLR